MMTMSMMARAIAMMTLTMTDVMSVLACRAIMYDRWWSVVYGLINHLLPTCTYGIIVSAVTIHRRAQSLSNDRNGRNLYGDYLQS